MKIELFRQSGKPVSMETALLYESAFKAGYDDEFKIYEVDKDMEALKTRLAALDQRLAQKYKMTEFVKLPVTDKGWKALQVQYGAPIMVAQALESNKTILILMDADYQ